MAATDSGVHRPEDATRRLDLYRPSVEDAAELHAILSDARLWTHYPTKRYTAPAETTAALERWIAGWATDGLGTWVARERASGNLVGYGGCSLLSGRVWNLGYRFAVEAQGRGFATELSSEAMQRARDHRPEAPIIASIIEHNPASAAVAVKLGMQQVYRGPDVANPDPAAIRLIYADRPLSEEELTAARG